MFAVKSISPKRLYRWRYQLGGCLLFAALLPYVIRWMTLEATDFLLPLHMTLIANCVAIFLGTWLFRSITTFPGAEGSVYIIPVFSTIYGALAMIFVLTRLDYNRPVFFAGFIVCIIWFYWVMNALRRQQYLRIGVVAVEQEFDLPNVRGVEWVPIRSLSGEPPVVDAVTTDLRQDHPDEWDRRLTDWALEGVPVYHFKHLVESLTGRVELEHLSENSFGSLTPVSAYMSVKHFADWLAAATVGVILILPLTIIGVVVRMSSPGPALFRQTRIGFRGQPFTVFKFRTMRVAEPGDGDLRQSAMTQADDQRVFPLGRFLRKSRLDELPQIINVLKGEMSWIGPRPEAVVLSQWYESEIPFYRYRHIVRPGIAGWAQVCQGHVSDVQDVKSKLHYDFYYIKNYSLWIDILITMRTVSTMITGFGSK